MCGILFSLCTTGVAVEPDLWADLMCLNTKRGPDAQGTHQITADTEGENPVDLCFFSTVLHLRGPRVVAQPVENPMTHDVLCWNGEIFGGLKVDCTDNDTRVLMDHLSQMDDRSPNGLLNLISQIEGPFAFVYWQARARKLWFARDCLGRRSLLWRRSDGGPFMLSSVGPSSRLNKKDWAEVPATGIYCIDLSQPARQDDVAVGGYPLKNYTWSHQTTPDADILTLNLPFPKLNTEMPPADILETTKVDDAVEPPMDPKMDQSIDQFTEVLSESVRCRVADIPSFSETNRARVAILFSGGIDCICLAALAHQHLPLSEPIDLLNVAFENPRTEKAKQQPKSKPKSKSKSKKNKESTESTPEPVTSVEKEALNSMYNTPDRLTGRAGAEELRRIAPNRQWNFVEVDVPYTEAMEHRQTIIDRMFPLDTVMDLSIAMAFWFASRGRGTITYSGTTEPYESPARVLISGLGADEQLGGYSRHREAFRQGSWERLIQEVHAVGCRQNIYSKFRTR
ncbi:asparagine synthase-domain-containing protein [Radiomyces spectabilis]|uniref:asparagine synthase-domain-containing protein n=1 Tax=Radiomyces spectabilis TaxID=64574 RepID=UPI00221F5095|nr:asparagine synthase-domain-containing protein [Radiomyces spectabilis]KAI8373060.1 asparagine synthase-domain-containing protein [Radiomyces spectabilis]